MEATEQQLWVDYRRGIEIARNQLLEKYLPLAKRLAAALYANRPANGIEFGDYLHLAYVGLLEAMQRYRHDSSAQFATFATYRIRGSVLNGIPRMTELGDHIGYLKQAQRDRTQSLLRKNDEVPHDFSGMLDLVVTIALTYQLDDLAIEQDQESLPDNGPYVSRAYEETQNFVRAALVHLSEREQQIIRCHYFHQVNFNEIAELLNITKGRVSQLHKRALEKIRAVLQRQRLSELY